MQEPEALPAYLSLSAASKLLGVHSGTLRRWADAGLVPVFVTPGGHRRFARSDLAALAARQRQPAELLATTWAARATEQTRSELARAGQPGWMVHQSDEERTTRRRLGQRLLGTVLRYTATLAEDAGALTEATAIGAEYAASAMRDGLPLSTAIEAALFFRDTLTEAALDLPAGSGIQPADTTRLLRRINRILNTVQLAITRAYEEHA